MRYPIRLSVACLVVLAMLSGCRKEPAKPPVAAPPKVMALDTLWSYPTRLTDGMGPILNTDGNVLINNSNPLDSNTLLELLDKETGKRLWQWKEYYRPEYTIYNESMALFDDQLVFNPSYKSYSVDIKTGQTNWRYQSNLNYALKLSKDQVGNVYQVFTNDFGSAYFYRVNHKTGKRDALFAYKDSVPSDDLHITATEIAYTQAGDKLLVFSMVLYYTNNMGVNSVINRMVAYNLNKNRYEWNKEFTPKYGSFSKCVSNGSEIYSFAGFGRNAFLVCIDAKDGSEKWVKALPDYGVELHLTQDNIIALNGNNSAINCFNQKTGNLVWKKSFFAMDEPRAYFTFDQSVVFKNYIFITQSNELLVMDINTGGIVYYKDIRPSFFGGFRHRIAIDAARRVFYVHDYKLIVCYKLPEEIVY